MYKLPLEKSRTKGSLNKKGKKIEPKMNAKAAAASKDMHDMHYELTKKFSHMDSPFR